VTGADRRLLAGAAGGEQQIDGFCQRLVSPATTAPVRPDPGKPGNPDPGNGKPPHPSKPAHK
jgi:hypothetical protein